MVQYTPRLNVYSVLFSNSNSVYVRVTSLAESQTGNVSQPVHGAVVQLRGFGPGLSFKVTTLTDTTEVIDGDTASFYYAPVHVIPGAYYYLSVSKTGYASVGATAGVPYGYATIPYQSTYSILQNPKDATENIQFTATLSGVATAAFAQMVVECRGLDAAGRTHAAFFNVFPIDSVNPFHEVKTTSLPYAISIGAYQNAYHLAQGYAATMALSHLYIDIIVTQVDDNFYRYFITSNRTLDPLSMRTDKIIFTNLFNGGTGIVAGAAVDTTRIFLY